MSLGDSRVGVDLNPSGAPRVADIERRAAHAIKTIGSANPPSTITRFKALAMTDVEVSAMGAAKAVAPSGRWVTRLATYRPAVPTLRAEAPRAVPAEDPPAAARGRPSIDPPCFRPESVAKRPPPSAPPSIPRISAFRSPRDPCTERLHGSPRARIRPRRGRKCPSRAPRRIDRHGSAPRPRHALRAQRAAQHRRLGYNILWLGPSIIAKSG